MFIKENYWKKTILDISAEINVAIKSLNNSGLQIVIVVDKNKNFLGTITDGDVRRGLIKGYNLKLDTTKEEIIEAPMFEVPGSTRMFGDDLIIWYASLSSGARLEIKFTLNRYTGRLREYHKHYKYGDTENNYWMDLIYDCSKAKKLF